MGIGDWGLGARAGDRVDLHERAHRQRGHLVAHACGLVGGEELRVDGIHRAEIGDVLEEDRRLGDIGILQAGGRQDGADVLERLAGLRLDAFGHLSVGRVDGELSGHVERAIEFNGLGIGADGFGCGGCGNDSFHLVFCLTREDTKNPAIPLDGKPEKCIFIP